MSFFYNSTKTAGAAKKTSGKSQGRGIIPIASLQALGCTVCPRNGDKMKSPKMRPSGPKNPDIYLLGTSPSEDDDDNDNHFTDEAGEEIRRRFGNAYIKESVRMNYITQCMGDQTEASIECCRKRIVDDIEATQPQLIVTVGDAPLKWIIGDGHGNALTHRGTLMVARIGKRDYWVLPIIWPNYVKKKNRYNKSEFELCVEHDIAAAKKLVGTLGPAKTYQGDYDKGVEIITGAEPGDMQRLEAALKRIAKYPRCAMDFESNGLRPYLLDPPILATAAIGTFEDTVAFPLDHPAGWGSEAQRKRAWDLFGDFLRDSGRIAAHHLGMEMEWLEYFLGEDVLRLGDWDDTMAMAHTLDERDGTKGLEIQTIRHFGFNLKAQSKIDASRILEYPIRDVLRYNGMDAKWTDKLRDHHMPAIMAHGPYLREYERKVRMAPALVLMSAKGLPASVEIAKKKRESIKAEIKAIESKIAATPEVQRYRQRNGIFEPGSTDHVLVLMRDIAKRTEIKRVDRDGKAKWSTDEEALSAIPAIEVPSAPLILEHRGLVKLTGTYLDPIITGKIMCQDGLIRGQYSSMKAETGRLSSDGPNMQNFPKRKHKHIRGVIIALPGGGFVACDYGQIEFRVFGMASEDRNLVKACWTGYDVHGFWAERMVALYPKIKDWIVDEFKVDWDEKGLKTLRQESKNKWVFPMFFGSMVRSCADNLHMPEDVADELAGEFWDEFAETKKWQERLLRTYEKNLYVETLNGRRRRGALSKNQIINHPIQGTAAEIVTLGMTALSEEAFIRRDPELQCNLNVHDDLSFLLNERTIDDKIKIITTEMCRHRYDFINVPLMVEVAVGTAWDNVEEIGKYRSDEIFGMRNPYA